jgi:tetratricopeptide (TPR) repeat protein
MASSQPSDEEVRLRSAYHDAAKLYAENPRSVVVGWEFARACFEVAEFATNNTERGIFAEKGIAVAGAVIAKDPKSGPANLYLGLNLGQMARTKGLGALKVVEQIERAFLAAHDLDPSFDFAGPDRCLGLLYRDAPAWISVGSRKKSKRHLEAAVKLAPNYPDNRLNLIETLLDWNDRNGALRELKALQERWEKDLKTFIGPKWDASVADWKLRYERVARRLDQPPNQLVSPRDRE